MNEVFAALLGSIVGGLLTIFGTSFQQKQQRRQRLTSLSAALSAEIASLVATAKHNNYASELHEVATLLRSGTQSMPPPEYVFSASQAYFTIFEANAGEIGELPPKVAVQVIAFYHQAKTFLDSMALTDKPNLKNVSAEVLVSHYAMVADFIDRLCTLGDDLVAQLAPADIRNHILRTAQQLDIKEAQQLLRVSWELLKELLTHSQCQLLTYLVSPLLNHSRY